MENIDKVQKEGMIHAEKSCRQLCMGAINFSLKLNEAYQRKLLWQLIVRKKQGRDVNTKRIRRMADRYGVEIPLSCSLFEARRSLKAAEAAWRNLKPKGAAYRQTFLFQRANNRDGEVSEESQKAARMQLRIERQREASRHLKRVLQRTHTGAVHEVEVLNSAGETVVLTDREAVEAALMDNNESRFRQTEDTPAMQGELLEDLGYLGMTTASAAILEGTYTCPPGTDSYTRDFFDTLKASHDLDPKTRVSCKITQADYKRYWTRSKERTSSSLSGLHFGHWKSAADVPLLAETHALFSEIAVSKGYSPTRWQAGLSAMLEKSAGDIMV